MKRKLILSVLFPVLVLLLAASIKTERDDNAVPGKIIIQFNPDTESNLSSFLKSYDFAGLKAERCLSADLNIWLLSFDNNSFSSAEILHSMKSDKAISLAQAEHYISLREKFPNDPSFAMQWALYNIGHTGGVDDADIDATLAWDVSVNNGTTQLGDSIVIAVVDDGFYLTHEDMNFWKNRDEIPDNGIDDDGNGYIDDFDGWNAYTGTGVIITKSHGTRVAGVAGAIGDNNTGICGVGWNNRILPVAGSSTFEATVVEALAYVYKMRSLYDETNGEKGAYIVATNGSFGVDYANPDDYPIWHMMYDSLGSLGILNAAATMNHESDVDIVGDVPTAFDTDYLIGIANTTKSDVKYSTSAWGSVSIDLGAPGSGILSTTTYNAYGYSTGTSLASPHVAGSIGLLFASADTSFLDKYHDKPAETAVFLKNIILEGVDTLSGFDTLCVSGGRLNVNNAVQLLLNPRLEMPETVSYQLAPDSTGPLTLMATNLLGFDLPYECNIASTPSWISCDYTSGIIPADDSTGISLTIDAAGLEEGTYHNQLIVVDAGGREYSCGIELNLIPGLGLEEPSANINVHTYPNPFSDFLNIRVDYPDALPCELRIFTLSGRLVYEQNTGLKEIRWEDNSLPSGVYIIHIKSADEHYQQKVVKL